MRFFRSRNYAASRNRSLGALFLIFEGIVYTMVINLYNPFIQMFAKRMGGNDIHVALLNSLPPLVAIFVLIPFGLLIEHINRKKKTVLLLIFILSLFHAAIAFVPIIPNPIKVMAYVVLIGFMNCPGALYLTTWQSFFADNFKGSFANRVYTLRSKYSTFFGLVTVLTTGILLTLVPKSDEDRIFLYQVFYSVCFLLTLVQMLLFSRVHEHKTASAAKAGAPVTVPSSAGDVTTKPAAEKASGMVQTLAEVACAKPAATKASVVKLSNILCKKKFEGMLSNKPFIIFSLCGFAFHLSWQMGWPLFFIYNADYAGLNELQLSLISVVVGLAQFFSYTFWSKRIERTGNGLNIFFGTLGIALTPLFYATLLSFPLILIINAMSGIFLAGFTLTLFYGLLETLPAKNKTVYISVFNTLINITGFIAPLMGVWIYRNTNIYLSLVIVGIIRIAASFLYGVRWWRNRKPTF